jgi:hypothetical protein
MLRRIVALNHQQKSARTDQTDRVFLRPQFPFPSAPRHAGAKQRAIPKARSANPGSKRRTRMATHVAEYYGSAGVSAACADAAATARGADCRIDWARSCGYSFGIVRALESHSMSRRCRQRTICMDRMASHRRRRVIAPVSPSSGVPPTPWFHGASNTWLFSLVVVEAIDRATVPSRYWS